MIDQTRSRDVTRRIFCIGAGKALLLGGLITRMYQLQLLEGLRYQSLADGNRLALRWMAAPRGRIFDRSGVPLAVNQNTFQAVLWADHKTSIQNILEELGQIINLSEVDLQVIEDALKQAHRLTPVILKQRLTWREVTQLEVRCSDWPGVAIEVGQVRYYPQGLSTAHIVGYVGPPQEKTRILGLLQGKTGIEKVWESDLQGVAGQQILEVNASRQVLREIKINAPFSGYEKVLSIDSRLQSEIMKRLSHYKSAAVVVLKVQTGEILASFSHPSFDPNLFTYGISRSDWLALSSHTQKPLFDKTITGLYAPGSTIKMAVILAALHHNVIDIDTRVYCRGYITLGNHRFHCWAHSFGGHGSVNLQQSIIRSCDIFYYEIAQKLPIQKLIPFFRLLGLGEAFLPGFPGVKAGLVPSPEWKKQRIGQSWTVADSVLTSIGQGYMLSTPLQLAVMSARLATRRMVQPSYEKGGFPNALSIDIRMDDLRIIQEAMDHVINHPSGTGYRGRILEKKFQIAGKTGTSQVRRISTQERAMGQAKGSSRTWEERDHAFFCGYAPVHDPKYSICVLIEHGGFGGSVAVPVARDILLATQKMDI